jgi:phospholipid transport system substrate-binding protein
MLNKSKFIFTTIIMMSFSVTSWADSNLEAENFINNLGDNIIEIASNKNMPLQDRKNEIIKLVGSVVDNKWIARFVLARNYRSASKEQFSEFQKLYRDFIIYTYAPSFKGYNGEKFKIKEVLNQGKYFMVKCLLVMKDGPDVNIAFRLKKRKNSDEFAILDIIAEGVSLIETQRSEFNSVISQKGLDGFLQDMSERVEELRKSANN